MNIRFGRSGDADALVDFNAAMALETEGKQLDLNTLRTGVKAVLDDEQKGFYVVADDGGAIVGGLLVTFEWSDWRSKWFWWVQSVYIIPEQRGKHIYSALYEFVKQKAARKGDVCGFRLYVEEENLNAQKVYERLGMEKSYYLMYEEST